MTMLRELENRNRWRVDASDFFFKKMTGVYTPAMSIFQSVVRYAFFFGFFRGWFQGLILLPLPTLCSENRVISWGVCIWEASLMNTSQHLVLILRLIPGFFRVNR